MVPQFAAVVAAWHGEAAFLSNARARATLDAERTISVACAAATTAVTAGRRADVAEAELAATSARLVAAERARADAAKETAEVCAGPAPARPDCACGRVGRTVRCQ